MVVANNSVESRILLVWVVKAEKVQAFISRNKISKKKDIPPNAYMIRP